MGGHFAFLSIATMHILMLQGPRIPLVKSSCKGMLGLFLKICPIINVQRGDNHFTPTTLGLLTLSISFVHITLLTDVWRFHSFDSEYRIQRYNGKNVMADVGIWKKKKKKKPWKGIADNQLRIIWPWLILHLWQPDKIHRRVLATRLPWCGSAFGIWFSSCVAEVAQAAEVHAWILTGSTRTFLTVVKPLIIVKEGRTTYFHRNQLCSEDPRLDSEEQSALNICWLIFGAFFSKY